ncbi:hypothetical protein MCOR25_010276 [Pyricularia grisea]|uniref:Programmed cell death protein 2 C-terminal domain-containing protein n=1 Tax=Pyricularia grisea TaxID=148305 RepID=A0A6P8B3D0_PYRGI|nr:uncharacterized protein PgNI_07089 [Pyricularia grisea]KAI6350934.1 hypothetical protein MCOR25_010276 [Pyricularia grisea]TLD09319.1 hypothetical protein PgNI_07089 [Pyricularia grisea]
MVNYDSDSSGEGEDYTETDVLLGYTSKEAGAETVSRLGGRPDWIIADRPPSAALARCKVCKDLMVLLLQLNGELPERFPGHERRLYVFACRKKTCRRQEGSIRTLRGLKASVVSNPPAAAAKAPVEKPPAAKAAQPSTGLGESLFGVKPSTGASSGAANPFANPFSTKPQPVGGANPFSTASSKPEAPPAPEAAPAKPEAETKTLPATFAEKLNINNTQQPPAGPPSPPEPWPAEDSQPKPYPISWISDAEYETLEPTPMPRVPTVSMDIDDPAAGGSSGKEDKVVFESSMDAQFQKFADRVGENPEQVIRYEYGGNPLLYSKDDKVGKALEAGKIPSCGNCGAGRVFEVQLAPHAITELEREEDGLDGMDWGTVIVAVCSKDCQERGVGEAEVGYVEEWAGVQWEELTMKR